MRAGLKDTGAKLRALMAQMPVSLFDINIEFCQKSEKNFNELAKFIDPISAKAA
jgi:hypothetical protein